MPVESNGYISALNENYPDGSVDAVNTLDNYMRTFKYAVRMSFPNISGAATVTHTELNTLAGAASTGTTSLLVATRTAGDSTQYPASTAFVTSAITAAGLSSALPNQASNAGRVPITDGTTASWGPFWGVAFTTITSGTTATVRKAYNCNTTSAAFTLTLPASPSADDWVWLQDLRGTFNTNALTVGRNGNPIEGLAEDMTVNTRYASVLLIYKDSTTGWKVS